MAGTNPLLPSLDPKAKVQLVCLPFAGGGTAAFHRWRSFVPPEIALVPLCLPGRESRFDEPPYSDLRLLANDAATALGEIDDCPIAILGHSMGAFVALEIARELRRRNMRDPELLIVSASPALHRTDSRAPISHLSDEKFLAAIMRRYEGIPEVVRTHQELLGQMLPVLRADICMFEQYEPAEEPPLNTDIFAMAGCEDSGISIAGLQAWRKYTNGRFSARLFPGGHFFLFRDHEAGISPNSVGLQAVVHQLRRVIETI